MVEQEDQHRKLRYAQQGDGQRIAGAVPGPGRQQGGARQNGDRLSRTDVADESGENMNTEVEPTNTAIEALLQAQMLRAQQLLVQHNALLVSMTEVLMREGLITPAAMVALCVAQGQPVALTAAKGGDALEPKLVLEPYAGMLAAHTQSAA